eukprot:TRINITY_DN395_c0_g1_i2.p1 TRINITY_DN395_c0_g1~~TRINITY_DN395_c0_g1_i2.p1  ORF type:complete len:912 (-),score=345.10 TRINITY_DN395_c0_g1_i2:293-2962(-)
MEQDGPESDNHGEKPFSHPSVGGYGMEWGGRRERERERERVGRSGRMRGVGRGRSYGPAEVLEGGHEKVEEWGERKGRRRRGRGRGTYHHHYHHGRGRGRGRRPNDRYEEVEKCEDGSLDIKGAEEERIKKLFRDKVDVQYDDGSCPSSPSSDSSSDESHSDPSESSESSESSSEDERLEELEETVMKDAEVLLIGDEKQTLSEWKGRGHRGGRRYYGRYSDGRRRDERSHHKIGGGKFSPDSVLPSKEIGTGEGRKNKKHLTKEERAMERALREERTKEREEKKREKKEIRLAEREKREKERREKEEEKQRMKENEALERERKEREKIEEDLKMQLRMEEIRLQRLKEREESQRREAELRRKMKEKEEKRQELELREAIKQRKEMLEEMEKESKLVSLERELEELDGRVSEISPKEQSHDESPERGEESQRREAELRRKMKEKEEKRQELELREAIKQRKEMLEEMEKESKLVSLERELEELDGRVSEISPKEQSHDESPEKQPQPSSSQIDGDVDGDGDGDGDEIMKMDHLKRDLPHDLENAPSSSLSVNRKDDVHEDCGRGNEETSPLVAVAVDGTTVDHMIHNVFNSSDPSSQMEAIRFLGEKASNACDLESRKKILENLLQALEQTSGEMRESVTNSLLLITQSCFTPVDQRIELAVALFEHLHDDGTVFSHDVVFQVNKILQEISTGPSQARSLKPFLSILRSSHKNELRQSACTSLGVIGVSSISPDARRQIIDGLVQSLREDVPVVQQSAAIALSQIAVNESGIHQIGDIIDALTGVIRTGGLGIRTDAIHALDAIYYNANIGPEPKLHIINAFISILEGQRIKRVETEFVITLVNEKLKSKKINHKREKVIKALKAIGKSLAASFVGGFAHEAGRSAYRS